MKVDTGEAKARSVNDLLLQELLSNTVTGISFLTGGSGRHCPTQ